MRLRRQRSHARFDTIMMIAQTSDLWWKSAVFYCLDVETFFGSDGDGIGDFRSLTERIDDLSGIGITCLWLMPFYPSPNRDDGYDVVDYYAVDPRLGTPGGFVEFVRMARDRGIRVIVDLVVNHTSREHLWFQAARVDRDSPYRDFYIWRDEPPEQETSEPVFPDAEDWDGVTDLLDMHNENLSLHGRKLEIDLAGYGYCWLGAHRIGQRILV